MIWCDQRWHPVVMCRSWCLLPSSSFGPCISVPPLNQIWQAPRASTCKTITGNWSTHRTESMVVMCTSLLTWALLLIVNTLLSRQAWNHSRCLIGVLIIIMLHLWVCRQLSGSKRELLSDGAAFFSGPFLRLIGEIYASSLNHCIRQSVNIWVVKKKKTNTASGYKNDSSDLSHCDWASYNKSSLCISTRWSDMHSAVMGRVLPSVLAPVCRRLLLSCLSFSNQQRMWHSTYCLSTAACRCYQIDLKYSWPQAHLQKGRM